MKPTSLVHKTLLKKIVFSTLSATLLTVSITPAANAVTDAEFQNLKQQFNQLANEIDNNKQVTKTSNTHIGGYGELHYNNLQSNIPGNDKKQIDLHRFVLFINHDFNDSTRFFSEVEIEHDNTEHNGAVEVEQAYLQFDLNDQTQLDAGIFLIPVGIINESHEPPVFYGVERNPVEKYIIPATWYEAGTMLSGQFDSGFSYDVALTSGLNINVPNNGINIRKGRQEGSEAKANNLAATARVKYTGIRGLELAGSMQYQDDVTQDSSDNVNSATLIETHARYNIADFTLTGLYARWDINGTGASTLQQDVQDGAYLEASYKITPKVGVFARQNQWDNGGMGDTRKTQTDIGINYWPHENVVIKADYQAQNATAGDADGFNLGIGYQF